MVQKNILVSSACQVQSTEKLFDYFTLLFYLPTIMQIKNGII